MVVRPDRWDKHVPKVSQCTGVELADFLSVAARAPNHFTEWEQTFCRSCKPWRLTPRQIETLDRGLLRKLWTNDPELWR